MLAETLRNPLIPNHHWTLKHSIHEEQCQPLQQAGELLKRGPSQRICVSGVETWEELVWQAWEPGREYPKTLRLRNVSQKLHKLRLRPPVSNFFTTLCPQTILMSPGTSFSLPVTFRPIDKCECADSVEFQSADGSFRVALLAVCPRHSLELPESVLLPPCAVQHTSQTSFLFRNTSKLRTAFEWDVAPPFRLSPAKGALEPREECRVTALFLPQEARMHQVEARCSFGNELDNTCTLLLRGLAKYPHLEICPPEQEEGCGVLDFGSVPVGATVKRHFEIKNPSSVSACFTLSRLQGPALLESAFACAVREGSVAPRSVQRVAVSFSPRSVDTGSVDYLCLSSPGVLSKDRLKVTGTCIGPQVSLSCSVVDFGCVEQGGEAKRTVRMTNASSVPAHYQFDTDPDCHSVFALDQPRGTLPANSSLILSLCFRPHHSIGHYRRLACLILHRDPLFLDLIGTCHSEQQKPSILCARHLRLYRVHLQRGLTCYPPDLLSAMLAENSLHLDQEGALQLPEDLAQDAATSSPLFLDRSPLEEYFHDNRAEDEEADENDETARFTPSHVTVQPTELFFHDGPSSQYVTIINHTKGRLSLAWTPTRPPFSVSPSSCDLGPLKTTAFRVTYMPSQHNTVHAAQLECFALYKVLRAQNETEDSTLCPPWCLTVRVSAHSFQPGREHFTPRLTLHQPRVVFPALDQPSYRNVLLQNTGDLPVIFRLQKEECHAVCVLPPSGLIPPGSHQILTLRSTPAEGRPASIPVMLQLNGCSQYTQELSVVSVVERLRVAVEGECRVFFSPTAVGLSSQRSLRIRNLSPLALAFHWRVSGPDSRVLSVQPNSGTLQPNESKVQTWYFKPIEEMVYSLRASLIFWPSQCPEAKRSRLTVRAMGIAATGTIQAEPAVLDVGHVLVGGSKTFEVPLLNSSSCPISFTLTVQQSIVDPGCPDAVHQAPQALEMDTLTGTVPAHYRMLVRSTVRPTFRARYSWTISYQPLNHSGEAVREPQAVCGVRAEGVYPVLEVTDARGCGSAEGLSKLQLWRLFSLHALNTHLRSAPLSPPPTGRHSLRRRSSVSASVMLDFNFSAAPVGSDPSHMLLMFQNTGSIPLEWSFLFPEDRQIEVKVPDNKQFTVSPRGGKLQVGQQRAVQFTYRHEFVGADRLAVLLKLHHGPEVLLNLVGETVERDQHYIHFPSSRHVFSPVAIGGFHPPQQVYELLNRGALPVRYRVDTSPLEALAQENFGHPVLQCLNPEGEVRPGHAAPVQWIFSPLEAKSYSVDIPIHVVDGDSTLVTFEGRGFDGRDVEGAAAGMLDDVALSVPCTQRVPLPGQVVFLSEERVSFGDIPVCSRSTRMLFLTNVSHTDKVLYTWCMANHNYQKAVQIRPDSGSLAAGESALCILTLQTSGSPVFYQLDLVCEVTLEEALVRHHVDLQQWEVERERQKHEFTLTEKDLMPSNQDNIPQGEDRASDQRHLPPARKYKTLPPIRSSSSAVQGGVYGKYSRAERRCQPEPRPEPRPEPPCPALLHLGVTARSHTLLEYQTRFPSLFNKHHIIRSVQPKTGQLGACEIQPCSVGLPALTHGPERDIITHTLTSILRSLLDDPTFHQSLVNGLDEPVPYFTQLRQPSACSSPNDPMTPAPCETHHVEQQPASSSPTPDLHDKSLSPDEGSTGSGPDTPQEQRLSVQEAIHRRPEFSDLLEDVLLNTLQNLLTEAFLGELVLTARPRIIALPPRTPNRRTSTGPRSKAARAENGEQQPGALGAPGGR